MGSLYNFGVFLTNLTKKRIIIAYVILGILHIVEILTKFFNTSNTSNINLMDIVSLADYFVLVAATVKDEDKKKSETDATADIFGHSACKSLTPILWYCSQGI